MTWPDGLHERLIDDPVKIVDHAGTIHAREVTQFGDTQRSYVYRITCTCDGLDSGEGARNVVEGAWWAHGREVEREGRRERMIRAGVDAWLARAELDDGATVEQYITAVIDAALAVEPSDA